MPNRAKRGIWGKWVKWVKGSIMPFLAHFGPFWANLGQIVTFRGIRGARGCAYVRVRIAKCAHPYAYVAKRGIR